MAALRLEELQVLSLLPTYRILVEYWRVRFRGRREPVPDGQDEGKEDREADEIRQIVYGRQSCGNERHAEDGCEVVPVHVWRDAK